MKLRLIFILSILAFNNLFSQTTDTLKVKTDSTQVTTTASQPTQSTRRDQRPLKDRISLGFGSSFWITANQTYVELAPVLAYRFPKALVTGVGYRYIYRHQRIYGLDLNSWGPDFFARLQLLRMVYMWTEYEILNTQYLPANLEMIAPEDHVTKQKTTSDALFAGLGFIKSLGKKGRGGLSVQVLYNFFYERDDYSPYYSPVTYRVGYYF
jgi:hypothetical protein